MVFASAFAVAAAEGPGTSVFEEPTKTGMVFWEATEDDFCFFAACSSFSSLLPYVRINVLVER